MPLQRAAPGGVPVRRAARVSRAALLGSRRELRGRAMRKVWMAVVAGAALAAFSAAAQASSITYTITPEMTAGRLAALDVEVRVVTDGASVALKPPTALKAVEQAKTGWVVKADRPVAAIRYRVPASASDKATSEGQGPAGSRCAARTCWRRRSMPPQRPRPSGCRAFRGAGPRRSAPKARCRRRRWATCADRRPRLSEPGADGRRLPRAPRLSADAGGPRARGAGARLAGPHGREPVLGRRAAAVFHRPDRARGLRRLQRPRRRGRLRPVARQGRVQRRVDASDRP